MKRKHEILSRSEDEIIYKNEKNMVEKSLKLSLEKGEESNNSVGIREGKMIHLVLILGFR